MQRSSNVSLEAGGFVDFKIACNEGSSGKSLFPRRQGIIYSLI